jgi:hypothetical protein
LGSDKVKISDNAIGVLVGERGYLAVIGEQLLPQIGEHCRLLGLVGPCALISDENVAPIFSEYVAKFASATFEMLITSRPGGDRSNRREICVRSRGRIRSFVIALGGG